MKTRKFLIAAVALGAAGLMGAGFQLPDPPQFAAKLAPGKITPGATVKGTATITFAPDLHGYQNPPTLDYQIPVKLESATKGLAIKPTYPKGVVKTLMGEESAVYEGKVEIPFTFKAQTKPGTYTLDLKMSYQQCNDQNCFPPDSLTAKIRYTVAR